MTASPWWRNSQIWRTEWSPCPIGFGASLYLGAFAVPFRVYSRKIQQTFDNQLILILSQFKYHFGVKKIQVTPTKQDYDTSLGFFSDEQPHVFFVVVPPGKNTLNIRLFRVYNENNRYKQIYVSKLIKFSSTDNLAAGFTVRQVNKRFHFFTHLQQRFSILMS